MWVRMRINETRKNGFSLQVDPDCLGPTEAQHFRSRANGENFSLPYGHGLSNRRVITHGDDFAAMQDRIGITYQLRRYALRSRSPGKEP